MSIKTLYLGDPHVAPSNLKESEALMRFVLKTAVENKVNLLTILGDSFHTHAILRLEVLEFWDRWFHQLADRLYGFNTIVLRGNHDAVGSYTNDYSALEVFNGIEFVDMITSPVKLGIFGYLPYIHDNEKFVQEANRLAEQGAKVLVSHTTYEGSKYDNGMFTPDGVNPDLLDSRLVHLISGHIHSSSEFGRVWLPGTARWLTASCANKKKGIWIAEHDENTGQILNKEFISTEEVCTPIYHLTWNEGQDRPEIKANSKTHLELIGSSHWISKQKKELLGSVSISSKTTDVKKTKERKSGKSLAEFLKNHYNTTEHKRNRLLNYMEKLNLV